MILVLILNIILISSETCYPCNDEKCNNNCNKDSDCAANGPCGSCINKEVTVSNQKKDGLGGCAFSCAMTTNTCECINNSCRNKPTECSDNGGFCTGAKDCGINYTKLDSDKDLCYGNHASICCVKNNITICPSIGTPNCPKETQSEYILDENNCTKGYKCIKELSNGRKAEVKIMPETASQRAIERLGGLGFNVSLKEVGTDNKLIYELSGEKEGKMFGLFKVKGKVSAEVDAETGEIIKIHKPWWDFLASGI